MTERKTTTRKPRTTRTKKVEEVKEEVVKVEETKVEESVDVAAILKELEELKKQVAQKEVVKVEETKKPATNRRRQKLPQIDQDELIATISRVEGTLFYKSSKTMQETTWSKYGDVQYLPFGEIMSMKASQPRFIDDAWLIIDDEEVIDFYGLNDKYDTLFEIDNLEDYLTYSDAKTLEKDIATFPQGLKHSLGVAAKKLINEGEGKLDSVAKRNVLEKQLKIFLD